MKYNPLDGNLVSIWGIPYPVKRPTARDIKINEVRYGEYMWRPCIINGKEAWTNTEIIDLRQPQYDDFLMKINADRIIGDAKEAIPATHDIAELELLITKTNYFNGKVDEIFYFLKNDVRVMMVDPKYYNYFKYFYPGCTLHSSGDLSPIVVKLKGEMVGILMPVRPYEGAIEEALKLALHRKKGDGKDDGLAED